MQITSSAVFYLISKNYKLTTFTARDDIFVNTVRIYTGGEISSGFLYVAAGESAEKVHVPAGCALLIYNAETIPEQGGCEGADTAYVSANLDFADFVNETADLFWRLYDWDSRLRDALDRTNVISRIFEIGKQVFDLPFSLIDRNHEVIAYTPDYFDSYDAYNEKRLPLNVVYENLKDREFQDAVNHTDVFLYPSQPVLRDRFACMNIFDDNRYVARTFARIDSRTPCGGEIFLFKRLSEYIGRAYIKYTDDYMVHRQNDKLNILINDMLTESVDQKRVFEVLSQYGWKNDHEYIAVLINILDFRDFDLGSHYICRYLEQEYEHSCTIERQSQIFWVVNCELSEEKDNKQDILQTLAYIVRDLLCKAGVSDSFRDFQSIDYYFAQAEEAQRLGQIKNPHLWYYIFSDYVLDYILEAIRSDKRLCHHGIVRLMEYDKDNDTDYTESLYKYVTSNFSITKAAEKSFVHRTTFLRRLEKIREISQLDLEDPDTLLHVLISFRLI